MSGRLHTRSAKANSGAHHGSRPASGPGRGTGPGSRGADARGADARGADARGADRPISRTRSTARSHPVGRPARPASRPRTPSGPPNGAGGRRLPVAVAVIIALVVVGTSFPAAALLRQHTQLASASAALHALDHQNQLLTEQQSDLKSKAEIEALARQDYQLVLPGQSLFNVLPTARQIAKGRSVASEGDPGNQAPVPPADAPDMSPGPALIRSGTAPISPSSMKSSGTPGTTASTAPPNGTSAVGGGGGFWHRVSATLEFWH